MEIFLGIDLAASSNRPTGFCIMKNFECHTGIIKTDEEILELAKVNPSIIAIDSPLSFSLKGSPFRVCDLEARRRKFMVLPLNIPTMKNLTIRGIKIKREFNSMGFKVIEVFPTGAFKAMNIIPPKKDLERAIEGLRKLGLIFSGKKTIHELDAIISAYVAYKYFKGEVELLGIDEEGIIVIPIAIPSKESI
ncbi:MAG: DUF429 domain-containing protein [Candidatus Methanomethyliaceae archaeon]|nr:DUF429 domain-containing protein [Candidatus Methanomethyliaceae archaeon]